MIHFFIVAPDGVIPDEFHGFKLINSYHSLLGLQTGEVFLHLRGDWWSQITPEDLRKALINMSTNPTPPLITIGL